MKIYQRLTKLFILITGFISMPISANSLTLYGAGSLKAAMTELTESFTNKYEVDVTTKFAPSGLLRQAIEDGESPDIFTSANMAHPEKLAASGWGGPVVMFSRNQLCAIAQEGIGNKNSDLTTEEFLQIISDEKILLGTSTPKADPSGDYAWDLFDKAEQVKSGSFDLLSNKAQQLTGGENSEKSPDGKNQYAWVMAEKKADIFLTYCTNAVLAKKEDSSINIINIPDDLSVGASYGLIVRKDASTAAWQLAMYILSPEGQSILQNYGFEPASIPK